MALDSPPDHILARTQANRASAVPAVRIEAVHSKKNGNAMKGGKRGVALFISKTDCTCAGATRKPLKLSFCETRPSEGVSCSPLSRRLLVRDRVGILLWTRRCVMERRGLTPRLKLKQLEKKLREQDISCRTFLITVRVV